MKAKRGRPAKGMERLVVSVPAALREAVDARVAAQNEASMEPVDRGTIVRAILAKALAPELRASG
jgi:hypothetical protein